MSVISEQRIAQLIGELKPLSANYLARMQVQQKAGHQEQKLDVTGVGGSKFRIILRQNRFNTLDFSLIVGYFPPQSNKLFRLQRYDGKSHEHTNSIEGVVFYDFHIHIATERYQSIGAREDFYAEPSERFVDFRGALKCLLDDCNFKTSATSNS